MRKTEKKKVRSVEVEKVKDGKGGHLHKVSVRYHPSRGKEGKGFGESFGKYHEPEETYHKSSAAAHKHVKKHMSMMTATPEEEMEPMEAKEEAPEPPGQSEDGETGTEDTE